MWKKAAIGVLVLGGVSMGLDLPTAVPQGAGASATEIAVAERNGEITKAISEHKILEMSLEDSSVENALQFLIGQLEVKDLKVDFAPIEKAGVALDSTLNFSLKRMTVGELLHAILWQVHPKTGSLDYVVEGGELKFREVEKVPALDDRATKRLNEQIAKALSGKLVVEASRGETMPAATLFRFLMQKADINLMVDWVSLEKAGIAKDAAVSLKLEGTTVEAMLKAVAGGLKPTAGKVVYKVVDGTVRVWVEEEKKEEKK